MNNLNTEPTIKINDILETNKLDTKLNTDLNTDLSTVNNEIPNENSSYKSVYDIPVRTLDGGEKELDKKPIKSKTKTPLTQKSTKKTYKSVYDINPRDFDKTGSSYMISQTGGYTSATYDKIQSQTPGIVDLVNNNIIETYKTLNPEPVAIQETPQALLFDEQISLIDKLTNDLNDSIKQGITNFTPLGTLDTPMDRLNINEKGITEVDSIIKNAIDNPTIGNKIRARIAQQGNEIANKGGVSALQNTIFKEINDIKAEYEKQVRLLDIEYKSKQISKDTDIYRKDKQKLLNDYSVKVNKIYAEVPELKELQQHGFSTKIANKLGIQDDRLAVIQKRQQIRDLNIYKKQVQQEQYKYEHRDDSYVDNIVENTLNLFKRTGENITSFESMPVNYGFEAISFTLGTIADATKTNLESLLYENSKIARNNPNASWYYKDIAGVMDFVYNIPLGFIRNASNLVQDVNPFSYLQNNEYDILNGESSYVGTRVFDKYAEQRGKYTPNETNWFESYVFAPALQTAESVVLFGLEGYLLGSTLGKVTAGIVSKVPKLAKLPQITTALTTGYLEGQQIGDETARVIFQDAYYNQGLSLSESKRKAEYGANIAKITNAVLIASSDFIQLGTLFKGGSKVGLRKLYSQAVEDAVSKSIPRELAKKQAMQALMQSPITRQAVYKTIYEGLKSAGGEYYEETIANEFAKYLGVSAADNNKLLDLSTWGNAIKETAHGFVELETQLGGIWGAIGGGATHLMFNHAMNHNININQIDPNGDLLYIQPDGSISTNVTNKVATKTEAVKGWQLEHALQRQGVGQYLEALTNDNYFQIQAYSQLQEELEKKNKGEAYSQDKIDYLRRNIFNIYNYRQSTNGNHNDLINQMNETLQMSQQDAIDKGLAENDTDTKWKTELQENIDNLTILGTKLDALREKYSIDEEPNSKQSSLYQAEVYKAIQENELSKLEKQLNIHKSEYEDYIKRNKITENQRALVDTFSQIQELTKQIQDLQESLNTQNLTNATISELFDITQSKKELLKNIKIAIADKNQQLKQLNTQFEELNKSDIEQDLKLKQFQDDYSKAIKDFNESLTKVQSYSSTHDNLIQSHKKNEISINKLKVNIHRLLTENNGEDLILKQEQLKILENKQKDLTKKIKESKKIYDTEYAALNLKENNIKTLRENIDKKKTDLQKKQKRLQNKVTKFYQEHNNYTNALKLINKVKNNIEISKNSIAAMNKNNLNFIHTMRISSLIQKQAEYTNRISHRYVGIQNAVLNNNYEDVLYNKINHTNLNQYLDWQAFTKLDEAGKQKVLKLIKEVETLNNATSLNKIIDDKGVAHIVAKRKAIMDILNHTNTTIHKVEKSIQNKEPKATTPEEHSLINQLKEFLQVQQAYRDTYTHVLNTIDTILQQHSDEITKIEEQEKYKNGTEIKPTNESVLEYIDTILNTVVIDTKNNKTTIENIPNKNGFLALFNAISLINKNQIDQNILLKLKSLKSILNQATEPFFDSVKLNSVIQYLTTNTTTDIEITLEDLQNDNIEDELILRGSLDGVLEGLDILEALMKNTLNDIQNIMRLYETSNIPEQKLEYLNQVLSILDKMKYVYDQLQNMGFMSGETLNKLENIGIVEDDIADITQKIFMVNTSYRVISKDIPQFKEKIKELQQQINDNNLDSELVETQEEIEAINKEIIKNIFKPISDYFQIEIPVDDTIISFETEVLTTELIETLEDLNETLNGIDYSDMSWVQKLYDIINDLHKNIYKAKTININNAQKQEIVKFIINKVLARNMNNEILDMIIFQQQELQPQSTVDSVTKKLPIVSYIIDAANRNEIIRYENDTTNSKRLILLVQSLRQLMNIESNTITFEKQIIEYGNDETFGGYLNNSKVNRKYTTFVIPNTNFSLPSLEHTKIVLKLLQNDNIDEVLRKLLRLKNNRKHLSNEEFINQYNTIVSDKIKKDFEAHFIEIPNDINSYVNKIASSINSYTKRLDRYANIKEHIPDCEAIIKLYETNEKTLTLEFENNIELTVIPVFDMSNKKHFAANTPSLVTIEKFNNDVNNEHNLSKHFELAIPQTATQTTNQYYIGNKSIELNKEHRGLILNPISENATFDPNKPFGGNTTLQLESTKFTNELIDEIYNNLTKLHNASEEDIEKLVQNISLYFTNTTSGNKFFEHNSILKYINIGLQSNNKNIELRIQYDKNSINIIYSEEKKLQRSTDELINSSLEINNNIITVEGQTIKTKLVEGVMTYTLTKNNKKTTINKQEAINILKTKPTYVQNIKTSINKETFTTILSNNYISFNYKQLRDMQQQGVNVLDKIGKHLKIRQGVIKEQGKVVETLIPKVLVNDKIQELFIFIPEIKQKEIEKTTALSSPIGETKKPTFKTISKRSINNKMRNARVIYLHDEIALDDNYLIHIGDALQLEEMKVQAIKENKIVVTKMKDKADIVFVSNESILNTEFSGYNNIYTGDANAVLKARFTTKVEQLDLFKNDSDFESGFEVENNLDKIEPMNDTIQGVVEIFDGKSEITSKEPIQELTQEVSNIEKRKQEIKNRVIFTGTDSGFEILNKDNIKNEKAGTVFDVRRRHSDDNFIIEYGENDNARTLFSDISLGTKNSYHFFITHKKSNIKYYVVGISSRVVGLDADRNGSIFASIEDDGNIDEMTKTLLELELIEQFKILSKKRKQVYNSLPQEYIDKVNNKYQELLNQNNQESLNQNNKEEEPLSKEINAIIEQFDMELKDMSKEDLDLMFEDHNVSLENRIRIEALWDEINTELNNEDEILKQDAILETEVISVFELFESNPELANAIYETLGFGEKSNLPTVNETINIYAGANQNTELSNFAIRPFTTNVKTSSDEKQYTFKSVEQGFHFYKALVANNPQVAKQILATTNGGQLKRLTNRSNLKMTPEQIKEWDDTSKSIMLNLMYDSYVQNPKAAEKLLATGNAKITHIQDNTRWKTDFPDVVMTVRDILREEGFGVQSQITPQQKHQAQQLYSQYLEQNPNGSIEQFKNWVNNQSDVQYQLPQGREIEEFVASEKTIRDLAARMSDRIGIPVSFESDKSKKYKGKIENDTAYINLAYATLDTPIHEILGHPIIRAIKNGYKFQIEENLTEKDADKIIEKNQIIEKNGIRYLAAYDAPDGTIIYRYDKTIQTKPNTQLYQNLLKELEYGKGKEVLDRIKRDYVYKPIPQKLTYKKVNIFTWHHLSTQEEFEYAKANGIPIGNVDLSLKNNKFTEKEIDRNNNLINYYYNGVTYTYDEASSQNAYTKRDYVYDDNIDFGKYTLEEQQEEAIVELLGLMTAEKLDAVKDGKLISLLKRLLKEIKAFMRSLISQKEVDIDKLSDNMTLGDIADLLAYSNSKLILPGYEVVYTTPDNMKFKTYSEASNHISNLAKGGEEVDLSNISLNIRKKVTKVDEIPVTTFVDEFDNTTYNKKDGEWFVENTQKVMLDNDIITLWNSNLSDNYINKAGVEGFLEQNKQYEQSKEIIEEWKKVNNIQYNPEEVYSRGQGFYSVVGAYSTFDVELMFQNLLQYIEDNQKAGGEFTISAFTKPIDKQIAHLEAGGGKIKFKIYPKSEDILWAANADVYSGSVWDASEKVSKDTKSELLGVSYTKYPSLQNVNSVQPNLASIIDNLSHHHNELGITLTDNNFRLEYDEDIPYSTKKIINSINSILDSKFGKLVKPKINTSNEKEKITKYRVKGEEELWDTFEEAQRQADELSQIDYMTFYTVTPVISYIQKGIQPTQTNETLKESIESVKDNLYNDRYEIELKNYNQAQQGIIPEYYSAYSSLNGKLESKVNVFALNLPTIKNEIGMWQNDEYYNNVKDYIVGEAENIHGVKFWVLSNEFKQEALNSYKYPTKGIVQEKEYTSQALINTKIAKLKEVAKKYPRSLIRSEVRPISSSNLGFAEDESLFQRISNDPFQQFQKETIEQTSKQYLNRVLETLKTKMGFEYEIVNDIKDKRPGWLKDVNGKPVIIINEAYANHATPLAQYGELLINMIRNANKNLFSNLLKELKKSSDGKSVLENIKKTYPDMTTEEQDVKALVKILGDTASSFIDKNTGEYTLAKRIWNTIIEFLNKALQVEIIELGRFSTLHDIGKLLANPNIQIKNTTYRDKYIENKRKGIQKEIDKNEKILNWIKSTPRLVPMLIGDNTYIVPLNVAYKFYTDRDVAKKRILDYMEQMLNHFIYYETLEGFQRNLDNELSLLYDLEALNTNLDDLLQGRDVKGIIELIELAIQKYKNVYLPVQLQSYYDDYIADKKVSVYGANIEQIIDGLEKNIQLHKNLLNNNTTSEPTEYDLSNITFLLEEDEYRVRGVVEESTLIVDFWQDGTFISTNKHKQFEVMRSVIDALSYLHQDKAYNNIHFSTVRSGQDDRREHSGRKLLYNYMARQLFGEYAILSKNDVVYDIPIPLIFQNVNNFGKLLSPLVSKKQSSAIPITSNTTDEILPFTASNELQNKLQVFLQSLNFEVKTVEELSTKIGLPIKSTTDLLNKLVVLGIREQGVETLPKEAAYVAYKLLPKNSEIKRILDRNIEALDNYLELENEYRLKSPNATNYQIKQYIIIDYLANAIKENYNLPKNNYLNKKDNYYQLTGNKYIKLLKYAINNFKMFIQDIFKLGISKTKLNEIVDDIANDILNNIVQKYPISLENKILRNYDDSLINNTEALDIINNITRLGLYLSGSLALRKQGTVYRSHEEQLHDLDFTIPTDMLKEELKPILQKWRKHRSLIHNSNIQDKEIALSQIDKDYTNQLERELKNSDILKKIIEIYPNFKIEQSYITNNIFTIQGKINNTVVDIFYNINNQYEAKNIGNNIQNWQSIMKAKLVMHREKDMNDFINYKPFNVAVTSISKHKGFRHFTFIDYNNLSEQRYEETTRNASIKTKVLKFIPSKLSISDKNKCN